MYKIIELDIDSELSGDTGVFEVAWVEEPAIEQNFMYFGLESFYKAPDYVAKKACQAIKENEKRGNPAATQVGKVRGQQLCSQSEISLETIKRMKSYLERAATYNTGNWDDNGTISYGLWGGEEGLTWVNSILEKEEKKSENFVYPKLDESKDEFISRCIPYVIGEGKTPEQAAGQCYGMWENREFAEVGERGGIKESKKAPKSDTPNPNPKGEGTAKGDASDSRSAVVSERVEDILKKKSDDFNERYKDKLGYGVNVGMLKSVYQRGVGAYNTSHSPNVKSAEQWALARVNAFLYIVKNGRPENPKYTTDYDLLPSEHPKREKFAVGDKVSFDWDDTLETRNGKRLLEQELSRGSIVYIVSARNMVSKEMIETSLEYGIPGSHIYAVGSNPEKIKKVIDLGIKRHYDNNFDVVRELGKVGIKFDYQTSDLPVYVNYPEKEDEEDMLVEPFLYNSDCGLELSVFGYNTQYFCVCPGAVETFEHLMQMKPNDETIGMIRSAAQIADNIFRIEVDVIDDEMATPKQLEEAKLLVNDFKDLMKEIDDEVGMVHDVSYMDGHIKKITSYLNGEESFSSDCSCGSHQMEFNVDEYSDEEKETAKLLYFLKETDYEKFEAVISSMRGATESEIFQRGHTKPVFYFKYDRVLSGYPDRDFCMSIENRYFRRLEIDLLEDTNTEFGHNGQPYSKWEFKGGPQCVHAWRRFIFTPKEKNKEAQLKDLGMVSGRPGTPPQAMPGAGYYPGTARYEANLSKQTIAYMEDIECAFGDLCKIEFTKSKNQLFAAKDEERIIYTPLMIPDMLIPRYDEASREKYYVKFKPEVIKKIRDKFMIQLRNRMTNLEHSDIKFEDVVMVESWIVEGEKDKAYELGFTQEQIPFGTWMAAYKVLETPEGDLVWNKYIKSGVVKGASVEGNFLLNFSVQKDDDYLLEQIINILNKIID